MYEYSVVCHHTGEILFESPFLYLCDKFIHNNNLIGDAAVYNTLSTVLKITEYFNGYFELQMLAIQMQHLSK